MDKERFEMYVKIAERFENISKEKWTRTTLLMDIESADKKFNLQLEELLNADDYDFIHDVFGIISSVNRNKFPAEDFDLFVPRFSGKERK